MKLEFSRQFFRKIPGYKM